MYQATKNIDQLFKENENMLSTFQNSSKFQGNHQTFQKVAFEKEPYFNPQILELQTQNKLLKEHVRHLKDEDLQTKRKYDSLYSKYNFIMQLFLDMLNVMNENANLEDLKQNASFFHLFNKYVQFAEKEGNLIDLVPTVNEKSAREANDFHTVLTTPKSRDESFDIRRDQQLQVDLYEKVKDSINVKPQNLNKSIEKKKRIFDDKFL